jgi:hypothetical protein
VSSDFLLPIRPAGNILPLSGSTVKPHLFTKIMLNEIPHSFTFCGKWHTWSEFEVYFYMTSQYPDTPRWTSLGSRLGRTWCASKLYLLDKPKIYGSHSFGSIPFYFFFYLWICDQLDRLWKSSGLQIQHSTSAQSIILISSMPELIHTFKHSASYMRISAQPVSV